MGILGPSGAGRLMLCLDPGDSMDPGDPGDPGDKGHELGRPGGNHRKMAIEAANMEISIEV